MSSDFYLIIQARAFNGVWVNSSDVTKLSQLPLSHLRNIYHYCESKGYPWSLYLDKLEYEINRKLSR